MCRDKEVYVVLLVLAGADAIRLRAELRFTPNGIWKSCSISTVFAALPPEMQGDCLLSDGVENGRMEPYGLCCVQLLRR